MTCAPSARYRNERGFALVAAIFIVVVLALLGIMMVTIGGMQRATATTAVRGTQAYYAARSGVEWATFRTVAPPPAGPQESCAVLVPAPPSVNFTLTANGLNGFTVSVQCTETLHRERSNNIRIVVLTSTASSGTFGDPDYVSRTIQVTVTDALAP
jgi:MSHA biogenesis protein MshP